ncbi:MAG TPA: lanthionine synthetase C family protein, partial [Longimicrobium sp.]|nr:lanthionine synthetase C family protein [Longimicrobium sp.]
LDLHRGGVMAMAEMMMAEMGLPRMLLEVADGLLAPDPAVRWTGDPVRAALARVRPSTLPRQAPVHGAREANGGGEVDGAAENDLAPRAALVEACERLAAFFEASAGHAGPELLWPASPDAHGTNGASIQFGAGGPVEFVRRVRGTVPDAWLEWLEGAAVPERCPPGMYTGLAGVALTLDAAGQPETVGRLLRVAAADPRLADTPGLYHGVAGVGTVALALAARQDDPELERVAVRIGDELAARARRRARGLAWPVDGTIAAGLGAGGSGIALFYTYLGARIGEPRYWELAKQALRFEFSQARWRAGYAFWPSAAGPRPRFRSPHVYFGSAGVATAAARLYACTGDPDVRSWAETAARTLTFRWTNKLWQDFGYAGWGETLLDMQVATGEAAYHHHARRMAQVLLAAQVPTRFGTAFPGGALNRVAADFGMGASGIGVFLHRLATPGTERAFYPDHLLPGWSPALPETPARIADALVVSELSHAGTA